MALHDSGNGRSRILIALLAVLVELLIGMAVEFLVDPADTKRATIARLWW